ncbi:MAG: DUF4832 domain-containing protein [Chamaesiphon sp.]|nr:DUF4832 domain-containing protein [Chamaesiphon sp.]
MVTIFLVAGMVSCGDKDNESDNNNNPPNPTSSTIPTSKPISTNQPSDVRKTLEYAPAAVDNPLKGLVPYQGDNRSMFPHSLEFNYIPYSKLVKGYNQFDWQPLEKMLNDISSRGHQAVFRIYLEYPDQKTGIPSFLVKDGLKITKYPNANSSLEPPSQAKTPNYEDKNLRRSLNTFIIALGKKYDGDPRIGFITAGLLGSWGEWHTDPRPELFASKVTQKEVLDAYTAAFKVTPVLLRYPVGENDDKNAANAQLKFGYHDDSFAWGTLDTGAKDKSWFYMPSLKAAGTAAEAKWKIAPIGGEIRPEAWGEVFDETPSKPEIQSFRKSVEATHASWVMDSGMFRQRQDSGRIDRAAAEVRRMGYEFHVPAVQIDKVTGGKLPVHVELVNRGVAPFYYDWPVEFGAVSGGKLTKTFTGTGKITGLLPNDPARKWRDSLDVTRLAAGNYRLVMRVPNRLPQGHPIKFANKSQDADLPGWLTLGNFKLP